MAKERPQLNIHELHRVRWLLGGLLALVAIWSVAFLEINTWALILFSTAAISVMLARPTWPGRLSPWAHRLAFPIVLGIFAFDFYTFGALLPALVRLGCLLLCYRACTYRKRRDDLQLVLIALFLVVATGVLTVSIAFAAEIILTAGLSLGLLFTRTLVDAAELAAFLKSTEPLTPVWAQSSWASLFRRLWRVSDWRLGGVAVILFTGLVIFSGLLFLAIPRYQLDNSLFLERWMSKRSVTGFSDTLKFGDVSNIEQDNSVAMHVEISDAALLPPELYWRMIVLDDYKDGQFRLSPEEREGAFSLETTRSRVGSQGLPIRATRASWTIYMEPDVSRFLPLTGGFVQLIFTEQQTFRRSEALRLVALARDPATMKAYRVEKMDTTGVLLHSGRPELEKSERAAATIASALPFDERQRAKWKKIVAEIDPRGALSSADFTHAAIAWLHRHHPYSLQSDIPAGPEDSLLRWTLSNQPGHCELFAGAFTMLARTAGFPTRVVAGFLGGDWNGDYLIVRNSHAHAWCEVLDRSGNWLRVDPTAASSVRLDEQVDPVSHLRDNQSAHLSWADRGDRVRMFWYRHIVNFDQSDQIDFVRSLQNETDHSTRKLHSVVDDLVLAVRRWLEGPWDWERVKRAVMETTIFVLSLWLAVRLWKHYRANAWVVKKRKIDPIRIEAGEWLERWQQVPLSPKTSAYSETHDALLRVRYGPRETWPELQKTFRQAKRDLKAARKERLR